MTVPDEQGCNADGFSCTEVDLRRSRSLHLLHVPSQAHVVGFLGNRDFSTSGKGRSNTINQSLKKVEMEKPNRTKESKRKEKERERKYRERYYAPTVAAHHR